MIQTLSSHPTGHGLRRLWWASALVLLGACGGGDGGSATAEPDMAKALGVAPSAGAAIDRPATRHDAARFLTQATFGPNDFEIELLMKIGYSAWIDRQLRLPATSHRARWEAADAAIRLVDPTASAGQDQVWESFWHQAVNGPDQLRLRMAFALSQIFVVSAVDGSIGGEPRALAAWLDMLGDKGFGSYRDLLETVSLHPLMGLYLTHLKNQKPDPLTGRIPDQNYARESMQLLSIGLVKLKPDGTPLLDANSNAIETYGPSDVAGLSNVFTGFSWACPAAPSSNNCFRNGSSAGVSDPDRYFKPMVAYPQFHSVDAKSFLGVTIPASTTANPAGDLKIALDTLSAHPNVGPFISKQLIQRLVTSNPSGAYVQAVAAVFDNNGAGTRGDLKAVLKAILLHPESRLQTNATGKVREPVLRLSAYLRAFPHKSDTGRWRVGNTDSVSNSLGQTPLRAPSVFNFYRPGYAAPGSQSGAAGMVGPELQLLNESSAAGWINYMRDNLSNGVGQFNGTVGGVAFNRRDLQRDWSAELALAARPAELVASVTGRLLYGLASPALQTEILTAITKITIPVLNAGGTNQAAIDNAKRNRVNATVLLTLAVPEFVVQK
ncbi:DUF1800 family protein [Ideonella sp. A 288]|uniref:DUF1800 domain-containing protein n=1 Tax=Ideonella sp. A 288 TaxID=1962181 RepID=UPI001F3C238C|nr:DUF1800 family protein [Ideonella sp. A 288]